MVRWPCSDTIVVLLALAARAAAQCQQSDDFAVQYDGDTVFSISRADRTCSCASFLAPELRLQPRPLPRCSASYAGSIRYDGNGVVACDGSLWTYITGPAPLIASLTPASGVQAGGFTTTIRGTGFTPSSTFRFGTALSVNVTVFNWTYAVAVVPANSGGIKDVIVTTERGTSTLAGGFRYGGDGSTPALAEFSCLRFVQLGTSRGDGLYWISGSTPNPAQVYCDMTTSGGGWTLIGHSTSGVSHVNMYSFKCGGGTYNPTSRTASGAIQAVALAQGSTMMAFGQTTGTTSQTGNMMAYQYATYFAIPNPAAVTFESHSAHSPTFNTQICTAVSVVCLKGCSGSSTRYTLHKSLGATWGDSFPTGYGTVTTTTCRESYSTGPYVQSAHSGAYNYCHTPPCETACDYTLGQAYYNHLSMYVPGGSASSGVNTIWLK